MWFYTKDKKNRFGPVPFEVLQQLARSGALFPQDMVQQAGVGTWVAAATVPGLFNAVQPIPSTSPSNGGIKDKWNKLSSGAKAGVLGVVLLPLFCCTCAIPIGMVGGKNRSGGGGGGNDNSSPASVSVSATQLLQEYKSNEVAADNRYKDKMIDVSGTIDKIGKDILDNPYVTLRGAERLSIFTVQCAFDSESGLGSLQPGQSVTIRGRCDGKFGNVIVKESRLVR